MQRQAKSTMSMFTTGVSFRAFQTIKMPTHRAVVM